MTRKSLPSSVSSLRSQSVPLFLFSVLWDGTCWWRCVAATGRIRSFCWPRQAGSVGKKCHPSTTFLVDFCFDFLIQYWSLRRRLNCNPGVKYLEYPQVADRAMLQCVAVVFCQDCNSRAFHLLSNSEVGIALLNPWAFSLVMTALLFFCVRICIRIFVAWSTLHCRLWFYVLFLPQLEESRGTALRQGFGVFCFRAFKCKLAIEVLKIVVGPPSAVCSRVGFGPLEDQWHTAVRWDQTRFLATSDRSILFCGSSGTMCVCVFSFYTISWHFFMPFAACVY